MGEDVKLCVAARMDMFTRYYTVPPGVQPEVAAFEQRLLQLAEQSADSAAFEAAFAAAGLTEVFTGLLTRCEPKPYQMTAGEKQAARDTQKQLRQENRGQIIKDVVEDVADLAMMEAESELIAQKRKAMIDAGVMDDYTRVTNVVEDVGWVAKGLGKLFGKGKKK